jgi:hypothetical protein
MPTIINASTTNGLVQTADGSGVLKVQSNGVTTNALAWVSFVGSSGSIRSSYNISSITRASAGQYTVNFTSSLADANYSASVTAGFYAANSQCYGLAFGDTNSVAPTTSSFKCSVINYNATAYVDAGYVNIIVFGN